jgi:beta-glucosidase
MLALYDEYGMAPSVHPGDMSIISTPTDFLGVNYYRRSVVRDDPNNPPVGVQKIVPEGAEVTGMGWEIYPQGLYDVLERLREDYSVPAIYITENGIACADEVTPHGQVLDPQRIAYLDRHLRQAHRATEDGVPLEGYFVWTLMDNFEWTHGYSRRFGIVYVDFDTQERIIKESGHWYRQVIERNGLPMARA